MKSIEQLRAEVYQCGDMQLLSIKRKECVDLQKSSHGMMRGAYDDLIKEIDRRIAAIKSEKEAEDELYRKNDHWYNW